MLFKDTSNKPAPTKPNHDSYLAVYSKFADSQLADSMRGKSRFSKYRPAHIDHSEWIKYLGKHADMLKISEATLTDAEYIVDRLDAGSGSLSFNEAEKRALLTAAVTFNWGKADIGDVAYEQKTSGHEEKERQAWRAYFSQLIDDNPKWLSLLEASIFDNESKTGIVFSAIKRMGYIQVALQALKSSEETTDPVLASHLRWLAAGVLSNQIHLVLEYWKSIPPFKNWLTERTDQIDAIFTDLGTEIFSTHGQGETQYKELFTRSKREWQLLTSNAGESTSSQIEKVLERAEYDPLSKIAKAKLKDELQKLVTQTAENLTYHQESFDKGIFGMGSNFESRFIPDWGRLDETVHALRDILGLKIVLTSGTFDIKHLGHDKYLEKASEQGDILIVGVDDDEKVRAKKGPTRPVVDERQRLEELVHARGVGIVTLKPLAEEKWQLIKLVRPDTLVVTTEHYYRYSPEELVELKKHVGRIVALPPQSESSTTARIRRLHVDFSQKLQAEIPSLINKLINDA